jgi:CHAT domain-containing protein
LETPVSLDQIQNELRPGEALLQILVGQPQSLVILILPGGGANSVFVRAIDAHATVIDTIVSGMRGVLQADVVGKNQLAIPHYPADLAYAVYDLLFGDLAPIVEKQDRLFVVSTGQLQSLPIEALVISDPGTGAGTWLAPNFDYSKVHWLSDAVEINYLPAVRSLVDLRASAPPSLAKKPLIAFGGYRPGVSANALIQIGGLPDGCQSFANAVAAAPSIPGTAEQAQAISALLGHGSKAVVNAEFTESYLMAENKNKALRDYRILHFGTHGLLPSSSNCFTEPALMTSFDPKGGDGVISTTEVLQFDLDAQLVVLSACDTVGAEGRASETVGESLSTLSRAFFGAGSRSVIASHWQVLAAETEILMSGMYNEIGTKNTAFGAALRESQRRLRRDPVTSHPTFWAAFVLVGDGAIRLYQDDNKAVAKAH